MRDSKGRFIKGHECPESFRKKMREKKQRENHWRWQGGKYISHKGYIMILKPEHPCNQHGYVTEQRLIIEQKLGRILKREERVHHKDFNKTNNHPANLYVFSNDVKHSKYHIFLRRLVEYMTGGEIGEIPTLKLQNNTRN